MTIDIGSSSLRINLFDADARRLPGCEAQLRYDVRSTPDGGAEIEPEALFSCLASCIDDSLAKTGIQPGQIAGVGFCSLVSNVMGIDADGKPTTPIYTWADTRCAEQVSELRHRLNEASVHERTGCHIHSSYLPARLLWLRQSLRDAYARTERWISLGDYIHWRLFGDYSQSLSVASWGGLLNRRTLDWDDWLLDQIGLDRKSLPALTDAYDGRTGLVPQFATRWPLLKNAVWFPCVGDGATGNLGSGCYSSGEWAIQVGTSGALRALVQGGVDSVPLGLWCYRLDGEAALLGGALSEGGNLFAWLRDTLHIDDFTALEQEAATLPPDSHGLTLLPFIAGERSVGWNASARMLLSGIYLSTRPADILRAAQEAVAYRFAALYDLLNDVLHAPNMIVASGGALLNTPGWMQIVADTFGSPLTASAEEEASSKGAALIALRGLHLIRDYSQVAPALGPTYTPNMDNHAVYRRALQRQQRLYDTLKVTD